MSICNAFIVGEIWSAEKISRLVSKTGDIFLPDRYCTCFLIYVSWLTSCWFKPLFFILKKQIYGLFKKMKKQIISWLWLCTFGILNHTIIFDFYSTCQPLRANHYVVIWYATFVLYSIHLMNCFVQTLSLAGLLLVGCWQRAR